MVFGKYYYAVAGSQAEFAKQLAALEQANRKLRISVYVFVENPGRFVRRLLGDEQRV